MPVCRLVVALFIMLGSSAVGLGGELMVFSSLTVQVVHDTSLHRKALHRAIHLNTQLGMNTEHFERELQSNLAGLEGEARAGRSRSQGFY